MKRIVGLLAVLGVVGSLMAAALGAAAAPAPAAARGFAGRVTAVNAASGTVTVGRSSGVLVLKRTLASRVFKNGLAARLSNLVVGDRVAGRFLATGGANEIRRLAARTPHARRLSGRVISSSQRAVVLKLRNGNRVRARVTRNTLVRVGGLLANAAQLHRGAKARITVLARKSGAGVCVDASEDTSDNSEAKGKVTAVDATAGTLSVDDGSGTPIDFVTDPDTVVNIDDEVATLDNVQVGDVVEVKYVTGTDGKNLARTIEVDNEDQPGEQGIEGKISAIDTTNNTLTILGHAEDGATHHSMATETTVQVTPDTMIVLDDQTATLADLSVGDEARVMFHEDGTNLVADAIKAHSEDGDDNDDDDNGNAIEGAITAVDTTAGTVTIEGRQDDDDDDDSNNDGATQHSHPAMTLTVSVNDQTVITRDGAPATLADLVVGDEAKASFHDNNGTMVADKIDAQSEDNQPQDGMAEGVIKSIDGNLVTITGKIDDNSNNDGTTMHDQGMDIVLTVSDTTVITRDGAAAVLADLQVGDEVHAAFHTDGEASVADKIAAQSEQSNDNDNDASN